MSGCRIGDSNEEREFRVQGSGRRGTGNGKEKERADRTIPERREAMERKHNPALLSKNNIAPIKTLLRISGFSPSVAESEADREFGRCRVSVKIGGCAW